MLTESRYIKQHKNESYRRWFSDEYFDLIVWYDKKGNIDSFQLCYDKFKNERVFSWGKKGGFVHEKIDDGEIPGELKKTPILLPDGAFEKERIAERFKRSSRDIDHNVAQFVYEKIMNYNTVTDI